MLGKIVQVKLKVLMRSQQKRLQVRGVFRCLIYEGRMIIINASDKAVFVVFGKKKADMVQIGLCE